MGQVSWLCSRRGLYAVGLALFLSVTLSRAALSTGPSAEDLVEELARRIWAVLRQVDLPTSDRQQRLIETIDGYTDVTLLGRLALGRYWHQLDDSQRRTYDRLFREVVIGSLARRLTQLASDRQESLEERFRLLGSQPAGRSDVLVRSEVRPDRGQSITLDWRLRRRDGDILIIDLAIEGVSLLVSQRSEFAAVIERSDLDGLLVELQARAQDGGS